jgi:hypothetical protein
VKAQKTREGTDLEAAVDEGLVKIEHETLAADVLRRNWGQERFWHTIL